MDLVGKSGKRVRISGGWNPQITCRQVKTCKAANSNALLTSVVPARSTAGMRSETRPRQQLATASAVGACEVCTEEIEQSNDSDHLGSQFSSDGWDSEVEISETEFGLDSEEPITRHKPRITVAQRKHNKKVWIRETAQQEEKRQIDRLIHRYIAT